MAESVRRWGCDGTVARLAKWLRILGYDTAYAVRPSAEEFAHWRREGRVYLSRRRGLTGPTALTVEGENLDGQLCQVNRVLGPLWDPARFLTRCIRCNTVLAPCPEREFLARAPEAVVAQYPGALVCPGCRRLYWPATHYARMRRKIEALGWAPLEGP